ncbi:unnamed protein product [Boreogadus saida]
MVLILQGFHSTEQIGTQRPQLEVTQRTSAFSLLQTSPRSPVVYAALDLVICMVYQHQWQGHGLAGAV